MQLLLDLPDAQTIRDQLVRIHADLILTRGPAETGNIHHVGYGFKLLLQHPVLQRLQFGYVITRIRAGQRIPVNLSHRAPVRAHLRLNIAGQRHLGQALQSLLAVPVVIGIVVENERYAGKPEDRFGAQAGQVRNAVHHDFDGNRHLLLHLFGGAARPLRDDVDVVVRHVRISLNRQIGEGDGAPRQQEKRCQQDQKTII